jgi:predicted metal-dependent phosphoesterase TrpH
MGKRSNNQDKRIERMKPFPETNTMIKVDLHVHTKYSGDCMFQLENLISACKKMGINCVAITDHDTIEGALKFREIAPFKVIIGEEIRTRDGEINGLFLNKEIPPGLSAEETIERIKLQGGLVYIPHPYSFFRREAMYIRKLNEIYSDVDIIECYNGRNFLFFENKRAIKFASEKNIIMGAGSDSHHQAEIGNISIDMEDFDTKEEFLLNLRKGKITVAPYSRRVGSFLIEASLFLVWMKLLNMFRGKKT